MKPADVRVLVVERQDSSSRAAKSLALDPRFSTLSVADAGGVPSAAFTFHADLVLVIAGIDDAETRKTLESVARAVRVPTVLIGVSAKQVTAFERSIADLCLAGADTLPRILARTPEGDAARTRLKTLARSPSPPPSAHAMRTVTPATNGHPPRPPAPAGASMHARDPGSIGKMAVSPSTVARSDVLPVVGVVASTGGPDTVPAILAALPRPFPLPIVMVQHLAGSFGATFAAWLQEASGCSVLIPADGEELRAGVVYLAPDACHFCVTSLGRARLDRTRPAVDGHRPSGTLLLESIAAAFGARAVGVVLTGMGADGADGLLSIFRAGGHTIAQDSKTCIVDGMPARARELGAAREVLAKQDVAAGITRIARQLRSPGRPEGKP